MTEITFFQKSETNSNSTIIPAIDNDRRPEWDILGGGFSFRLRKTDATMRIPLKKRNRKDKVDIKTRS
jgi:hypothetical protein